jgi:hypothetical protein
MSIKSLFIIGSLALSCAGQSATSIGGPTLGYALDPGIHALRPILGIAGASLLGTPLDAGFAIQVAAIDGPQGYALGIDSAARGAWLIRPGQPVVVTQVPVAGEVDDVFLSPQGLAAALLMHDGRIELLTGFVNATSNAPLVLKELPLGSRLERRPLALAVSDDGNSVAAAFDYTQAMLLGLDGTRLPLAVGSTAVLAFRPSSSDVVSSGPSNRVWLVHRTLNGPVLKQIAGPDDGIVTPAAVAFTPDGSTALIGSSGNATVVAVNLSSGVVSSVACGCKPVHFERLSTAGLFLLNDPSEQPIYLFDASSSRVLFVPPILTSPVQGQQN